MSKRSRDELENDTNDNNIIVLQKMITEDDKKTFKKFNLVADVMFGNYLKGTTKFLTVERPPNDKNHSLRTFLKLTLKNKYKIDELEHLDNGVHIIIDVYNNIKLYNSVYYLTQKKEVTFSMSVQQATEFLNNPMTENDFILELFGNDPCRFNVVYPMYYKKMITDVKFGINAVTNVLAYFKSHDRKYIMFGDTEKCISLLNWCVDNQLAIKLNHTDHPPIPTSSRFYINNNSIGNIKSIFQVPEANFRTIKMITDEWEQLYEMECDTFVNRDNDVLLIDSLPESINHYTLITTDHNIAGYSIGKKPIIYYNSLQRSSSKREHTYIFVFRNNTTSKQCGYLKHVLLKDITRMQSYVKYLKEHVIDNPKATFNKYILNNYKVTNQK